MAQLDRGAMVIHKVGDIYFYGHSGAVKEFVEGETECVWALWDSDPDRFLGPGWMN